MGGTLTVQDTRVSFFVFFNCKFYQLRCFLPHSPGVVHLHKSRLCVVPYTGLDLLEPLAGRDVIKWVKTEQVV